MRLFLLFSLLLVFFTTINTSTASNTGDEDGTIPYNINKRISFGQENLSAILGMSGGFNGKIILIDFPNTNHEKCMLFNLTQLAPSQNVITPEEMNYNVATESFWEALERGMKEDSIRVIHSPDTFHIHANTKAAESKLQVLKNGDGLAVYGSGNISSFPHFDIFHPEDPYWSGSSPTKTEAGKEYQDLEAFFQSGHVIMSSYAMEKPATYEKFRQRILPHLIDKMGGIESIKEMYQNAGRYIRYPTLIRLGDLKEYGFTVLLTGHVVDCGERSAIPSASYASSHVAVFAFYLFQLWDTTAEVVEVMQKTAIDIGKPGVDEEFGWGLINADHPIIWDRSVKRLQQSLSFCLLEDIAFEEAVTVAREGFNLFYDVNNSKREIGFTYDKGTTTLAFTTGSTSSPFGLSSRFLQQQQNTFAQCGLRYSFTDNISLLGVFGRSEYESVEVSKGGFGISYQANFSDKGKSFTLRRV